jgi:hypothetical protein
MAADRPVQQAELQVRRAEVVRDHRRAGRVAEKSTQP